jgi:outer membrane murein-binding lipoprotein Lpp
MRDIMRKLLLAAVAVAALAVTGCSDSAPTCTAETLAAKAQELATAIQEAVTKDPAKAAELQAKLQEITTKYPATTVSDDACKAYDEMLAAVKGS